MQVRPSGRSDKQASKAGNLETFLGQRAHCLALRWDRGRKGPPQGEGHRRTPLCNLSQCGFHRMAHRTLSPPPEEGGCNLFFNLKDGCDITPLSSPTGKKHIKATLQESWMRESQRYFLKDAVSQAFSLRTLSQPLRPNSNVLLLQQLLTTLLRGWLFSHVLKALVILAKCFNLVSERHLSGFSKGAHWHFGSDNSVRGWFSVL